VWDAEGLELEGAEACEGGAATASGNLLSLSLAAENDSLLLEVWNANSIADDLIGTVEVELPPVAAGGMREGERCMYQLDTGGTLECTICNVEADEQAGMGTEAAEEEALMTKLRRKQMGRGLVICGDVTSHLTFKGGSDKDGKGGGDGVDQDFVPTEVPKPDEVAALIVASIKGHFLFEDLQKEELGKLVACMGSVAVSTGDLVIKQGDEGEDQNLYVVQKGIYDVEVDGKKVAELGEGSFFGELALLHDGPRAATVKATGDGAVWSLDRATFRYVLASNAHNNTKEAADALRQVGLLESLTEEQLQQVAGVVQQFQYEAGDTIITKGTVGQVFYIVRSGKVVCTEVGGGGMADVHLGPGDYFGERALMTDEPRQANVTAVDEVTCWVLDRDSFTELLGPLHDVLDRNLGVRVLQAVPILTSLTDSQRERLYDAMEPREFRKGDYIIRAGEEGDAFFIVRQGKCGVTAPDGKAISQLQAGDFFGEMALMNNEPRAANVVAKGKVECFALQRKAFEDMLGPLKEVGVSDGSLTALRRLSDGSQTAL
jgi:CRP-like cAMP-binding protein